MYMCCHVYGCKCVTICASVLLYVCCHGYMYVAICMYAHQEKCVAMTASMLSWVQVRTNHMSKYIMHVNLHIHLTCIYAIVYFKILYCIMGNFQTIIFTKLSKITGHF